MQRQESKLKLNLVKMDDTEPILNIGCVDEGFGENEEIEWSSSGSTLVGTDFSVSSGECSGVFQLKVEKTGAEYEDDADSRMTKKIKVA